MSAIPIVPVASSTALPDSIKAGEWEPAPCDKCLGHNIHVRYHETHHDCAYGDRNKPPWSAPREEQKHLHMTCRRCHWDWLCEPADEAQKEGPTHGG